MVWDFRGKYSHKFATPDVHTSANFAMCEAGEALDAWIRLNTGDAYNRASARDRRIDEELMQCAMMIMTALGVDFKYEVRPILQPLTGEREIIEKVFHELGMLPLLAEKEFFLRELAEQYAINALAYILVVVEDPVEVMRRVLHTIYKKRVQPVVHK
jgi:hypothetical protein